MRPAAFIILFLIMVSLLVVPGSASDVSITIENQQVKAKLALSLQQNMTQLPTQTSTMNMTSDDKLSSGFKDALMKALPGAAPSDLTVNLVSKGTWLNISAAMTVSGVSTRHGDILSANMTWKDFYVSSDLRAGDISYNTIGNRSLRPVVVFYTNASRFVGRKNSTITGINFLVNSTGVSGTTAEDYVGNFTLFDFRALTAPLEGWNRTYTLSNNTTTWRYRPPQLFNVSIGIERLNLTTTYFARYWYGAEIAVQGIARAHGDALLLDVGTGQKEWIMAGIVMLTVILGIVAQLFFRSRRKRYVKVARW